MQNIESEDIHLVQNIESEDIYKSKTKLSQEENQSLAKMCVTHMCELNIDQNQIQRTKNAGVDCNRKHNNISNDANSSIP